MGLIFDSDIDSIVASLNRSYLTAEVIGQLISAHCDPQSFPPAPLPLKVSVSKDE